MQRQIREWCLKIIEKAHFASFLLSKLRQFTMEKEMNVIPLSLDEYRIEHDTASGAVYSISFVSRESKPYSEFEIKCSAPLSCIC